VCNTASNYGIPSLPAGAGCVPAWLTFGTSCMHNRYASVSMLDAKYFGNYVGRMGDRGGGGVITVGSPWESGRAESIGDVTDDVA